MNAIRPLTIFAPTDDTWIKARRRLHSSTEGAELAHYMVPGQLLDYDKMISLVEEKRQGDKHESVVELGTMSTCANLTVITGSKDKSGLFLIGPGGGDSGAGSGA